MGAGVASALSGVCFTAHWQESLAPDPLPLDLPTHDPLTHDQGEPRT